MKILPAYEYVTPSGASAHRLFDFLVRAGVTPEEMDTLVPPSSIVGRDNVKIQLATGYNPIWLPRF
jgi:hypothetical protein